MSAQSESTPSTPQYLGCYDNTTLATDESLVGAAPDAVRWVTMGNAPSLTPTECFNNCTPMNASLVTVAFDAKVTNEFVCTCCVGCMPMQPSNQQQQSPQQLQQSQQVRGARRLSRRSVGSGLEVLQRRQTHLTESGLRCDLPCLDGSLCGNPVVIQGHPVPVAIYYNAQTIFREAVAGGPANNNINRPGNGDRTGTEDGNTNGGNSSTVTLNNSNNSGRIGAILAVVTGFIVLLLVTGFTVMQRRRRMNRKSLVGAHPGTGVGGNTYPRQTFSSTNDAKTMHMDNSNAAFVARNLTTSSTSSSWSRRFFATFGEGSFMYSLSRNPSAKPPSREASDKSNKSNKSLGGFSYSNTPPHMRGQAPIATAAAPSPATSSFSLSVYLDSSLKSSNSTKSSSTSKDSMKRSPTTLSTTSSNYFHRVHQLVHQEQQHPPRPGPWGQPLTKSSSTKSNTTTSPSASTSSPHTSGWLRKNVSVKSVQSGWSWLSRSASNASTKSGSIGGSIGRVSRTVTASTTKTTSTEGSEQDMMDQLLAHPGLSTLVPLDGSSSGQPQTVRVTAPAAAIVPGGANGASPYFSR
ncbi:hypothetical protein HK102_002494 [Quaeritorhiza haematococci]|nr:hypothetical protein HK102_002494 [Quaeritorhiza haematococci]